MPESNAETETATFNLPSLTLLVIASMVGAGVFTTSGYTLGSVGTPLRVLCCWVIGGIIAICGAATYGRLTRIIPQSGGEYLFLSRHVHPFAGFLAGWVSLTAGFSGAIATAAVAFEAYAVPDSMRPDALPRDLVAVVLVVVCGLAHRNRKPFGQHLHNAVICVKVLCLLAFVLLAIRHFPTHVQFLNAELPDLPQGLPLVTAMATSVVWISLSYAGFNAAIYVASESPDARKNVPKALLLGTVLVTGLYLVLNLIFVTATAPAKLAWQEDVAAVAAQAVGGNGLEQLIRFAICLGLLSSVSGMVLSGPRVYSKMADDGIFPTALSGKRKGVSRSVDLQTAIAVALILIQRGLVEAGILSSSLKGLLIYLGTTLSLTSAACAATIFLPSVRRSSSDHSTRADIASVVYVVATVTAVVLLVMSHKVDGQPRAIWHLTGAGLTFLSGSIAYLIFRKAGKVTFLTDHAVNPDDVESK